MRILVRESANTIKQWNIGLLFEDSTGCTRKDILPNDNKLIYKERKDFEKLLSELKQQIENYNNGDNMLFEDLFGKYRFVGLIQEQEGKWEFTGLSKDGIGQGIERGNMESTGNESHRMGESVNDHRSDLGYVTEEIEKGLQ